MPGKSIEVQGQQQIPSSYTEPSEPAQDEWFAHSSKKRAIEPVTAQALKTSGGLRIYNELLADGKLNEWPAYAEKYVKLVESISTALREEAGIKPGDEKQFLEQIWGIVGMSNIKIARDNYLYKSLTDMNEIRMDCDESAMLVFDIAKNLKIDAWVVGVPGHAFVRTSNFFLETTSGAHYPLSSIRAHYPDILFDSNDIKKLQSLTFLSLGIVKDGDEKFEYFKKATDANPAQVEAYNDLGSAYVGKNDARKEDFEKALAAFNEAISRYPGYANAYFNRGITFSKLGEFDNAFDDYGTAIDIYSRAIEKDPKDGVARNSLAQAYTLRGNLYLSLEDGEKAESDFKAAKAILLKK